MYNHMQLYEKVQQFTCRMYVAASSTTEVNDLRCQLFCAKSPAATTMQRLSLHAPPSSQLPGSKLEVMSTCSSHISRPYEVWMDR